MRGDLTPMMFVEIDGTWFVPATIVSIRPAINSNGCIGSLRGGHEAGFQRAPEDFLTVLGERIRAAQTPESVTPGEATAHLNRLLEQAYDAGWDACSDTRDGGYVGVKTFKAWLAGGGR